MKTHSSVSTRHNPRPLLTMVASFMHRCLAPLGLACLLLHAPAALAQLTLATAPPSGGGTEPRPNVIVTVDDSGSMKEDVNGNGTSDTTKQKLTLLRKALTASFGDKTVLEDDRIRLAWQAMNGNGTAGTASIKLGATNSMKSFSGTHRTNFDAFVAALSANNYTPSIEKMMNVFDYMNAPENPANPWANDPTVSTAQTTPYLACRRTFHIFMTDGLWNSQAMPGCTEGGKRVGTTNPPVCSNSKASCPSGYTYNAKADTNKQCKKGKKGNIQYTAVIWSANTSVWTTLNPQRVTNGDGVTQNLPDGTEYLATTTNNQIQVYRDNYGDALSYTSTLSDFAFSNWATDLQDGGAGTTQVNSAGVTISGDTQSMDNLITPAIKKQGAETVSASTSKSTALQEYWNPKNDPATWQHITQYMIGFGTEATNWGGVDPQWGGDTFGGDYAKLVNGLVTWPDVKTNTDSTSVSARAAELWHGAVNGRGKYIPATTGDALAQAFKDILVAVIKDTSQPLITVTTSSSTLKAGTYAYVAGYKASDWAGQLLARPLDEVDKTVAVGTTWDAVSLLDDPAFVVSSRFVLSYDGSAGISWKTFTALPTAQQNQLKLNSADVADSNGQNRVDYLRGDKTKELAQTGGIFRDRSSRLGDIVNSNIWHVGKPASGYSNNGYATFRGTGTEGKGGRTPMVYVGANDGMLHGVVATTGGTKAGGTELLAYVPKGVAEGDLRKLTYPNYLHQYFVDGSPFTSDAYISTPARTTKGWTTVLVGTLGLGGKGYFVLDATDPKDYTEGNASKLVILDKTDKLGGGTIDSDIGVITSPPVIDEAIPSKTQQVVQMNNDRWALVFGNGYNSINKAPVLLIQYLDGDKALVKLSPCANTSSACDFKGDNGLSGPQLIDLDGDGKMDVAYAGDLRGNVWKFNLSSATASSWSVGFSGQPFFTAKGRAKTATRPSATVAQPITTAPYFMRHPMGGIMVVVGTGRNLTATDATSPPAIDSFYGLWDNGVISGNSMTDGTAINTTTTTSATTLPTSLVQQTVTTTIAAGGITYYASSTNAVTYSKASDTKRGWYLDLTLSSGERVLINNRPYDGDTILLTSTVPKSGASSTGESCTASATSEVSYFYFLNMLTGKPPADPVFDLTTDIPGTTTVPNIITMEGDGGSMIEDQKTSNKYAVPACPPGKVCDLTEFKIGATLGKRIGWRNKQ